MCRPQHDFVQRYPEGGALGGPADRGFLGVPKRRNSTSALANSSKAANIRARVRTFFDFAKKSMFFVYKCNFFQFGQNGPQMSTIMAFLRLKLKL
jgi:hypothetical protein